MINLKQILAVGLIALTGAFFSSCSTGQGGKISSELSISLSSDKNSIFADGADAVRFTVVDNSSREDVTSSSVIYVISADGAVSECGASFSTETAGTYRFYAEYSEVRSSEITVTASAESVEGITLSASKSSIYSDGGDFSVLSLTDAEGNDVTAQGTFYADGQKIEGNRFSSDKGSVKPVVISAMFGSGTVENTVNVLVSSSFQFTSRALLEEITRTNCQYCPIMIDVISELSKDNPQTVIAYNVHNTVSSVYENWYSEKTKEFSRAFCDLVAEDGDSDKYTAAPRSYLNRSQEKSQVSMNLVQTYRNAAVNGPKDVAVALWSSSTADAITVNATIGTKKDFSGKIVAVLVDNGIDAAQNGVVIDMYRVMRAYYPSPEGQPSQFVTRQPVNFTAEFNLKDTPVTAVENCEVIVFVTDDADGLCEAVQVVAIGEEKGY